MNVEFKSKKLRKQCEDPKIAQKEFGIEMANILTQRVGELIAATSLLDIRNIPSARLHKLQGDRCNEYAVDLVHPFRLVFKPVLKRKDDINDLKSIDSICIEEVVDYHGKQKK
ncbi:MAG: hypothetical protein GX285_08935 [Clostridiales bacterium]|nr:hypothetical protein [Clostridiales bacterium]